MDSAVSRGEQQLARYGVAVDPPAALIDSLADLMHWSKAEQLSWIDAMRDAATFFAEESRQDAV